MDYLDKTLIGKGKISDAETAMSVEEASTHINNLQNWELLHEEAIGYHLRRIFDFGDADKARRYIKELKEVAEEMHAIPTIQLRGTAVQIDCHTPQLKGLHLNDFIMAAQANDLYDRWDIITGERDKVTEASDESFPASDPPGY